MSCAASRRVRLELECRCSGCRQPGQSSRSTGYACGCAISQMHGVPSLSLETGRGTLRKNGPAGFVATGPFSCSMALSVGKWAESGAENAAVNNRAAERPGPPARHISSGTAGESPPAADLRWRYRRWGDTPGPEGDSLRPCGRPRPRRRSLRRAHLRKCANRRGRRCPYACPGSPATAYRAPARRQAGSGRRRGCPWGRTAISASRVATAPPLGPGTGRRRPHSLPGSQAARLLRAAVCSVDESMGTQRVCRQGGQLTWQISGLSPTHAARPSSRVRAHGRGQGCEGTAPAVSARGAGRRVRLGGGGRKG